MWKHIIFNSNVQIIFYKKFTFCFLPSYRYFFTLPRGWIPRIFVFNQYLRKSNFCAKNLNTFSNYINSTISYWLLNTWLLNTSQKSFFLLWLLQSRGRPPGHGSRDPAVSFPKIWDMDWDRDSWKTPGLGQRLKFKICGMEDQDRDWNLKNPGPRLEQISGTGTETQIWVSLIWKNNLTLFYSWI